MAISNTLLSQPELGEMELSALKIEMLWLKLYSKVGERTLVSIGPCLIILFRPSSLCTRLQTHFEKQFSL